MERVDTGRAEVVMALQEPQEFEAVGDRVCWIESVCPDCGALIEAELPADCWRCGNRVVRV
jgi:hypothetical protein